MTQEVFVTVFRRLHTWAGDSSLLVWIFGITRNKVNRRFRGNRPRLESLEGDSALAARRERCPPPIAPSTRAACSSSARR